MEAFFDLILGRLSELINENNLQGIALISGIVILFIAFGGMYRLRPTTATEEDAEDEDDPAVQAGVTTTTPPTTTSISLRSKLPQFIGTIALVILGVGLLFAAFRTPEAAAPPPPCIRLSSVSELSPAGRTVRVKPNSFHMYSTTQMCVRLVTDNGSVDLEENQTCFSPAVRPISLVTLAPLDADTRTQYELDDFQPDTEVWHGIYKNCNESNERDVIMQDLATSLNCDNPQACVNFDRLPK